jgi:hypothetical protein
MLFVFLAAIAANVQFSKYKHTDAPQSPREISRIELPNDERIATQPELHQGSKAGIKISFLHS